MIGDEEFHHRLTGILDGPWAEPTRRAFLSLSRPSADSTLDERQQACERLQRALRNHADSSIVDPEEMRLRADLDQALLVLQILELAIQSGYLPEARTTIVGRDYLNRLLWSQAARDFVTTYEYPAIPMLACRVGFAGLRTVAVQAASDGIAASLQFAAFLAHLRNFYENEAIRAWIDFMDDFVVEDNEQDWIKRYWRGLGATAPERAHHLAAGAFMFVQGVASAMEAIDLPQRTIFALPHAYWLAKFFGLRIGSFRYEHDPYGTNWSWCMATRRLLRMEESDDATFALMKVAMEERVALLSKVFHAVDELVMAARTSSRPSIG